MTVIVIDAHQRSHTAVTITTTVRVLATKTVGTTTQDHLRLVKWAGAADGERLRGRSKTADTDPSARA